MKIFILGADGFIGSTLVKRILLNTNWEIFAIDVNQNRLADLLPNPRLTFKQSDVDAEVDWVNQCIKLADVVIPLVAIATPSMYVQDPIRVYRSVFETNIRIIEECVKCGTARLIFPSTSEVYGMSGDSLFNEEKSNLTLGPINKERWIYSCSKQLLDRIIWAYGRKGLKFTLFRPFNWIGHTQDDLDSKNARLIPKLLGNILRKEPMLLVDGGEQRRSFTDIDDGVDALMKIIVNQGNRCSGKILNIGNPDNCASVKEVAQTLIDTLSGFPESASLAKYAQIKPIDANSFYGAGYQDVLQRVPDINAIMDSTGWTPKVNLHESIGRIVSHHLSMLNLNHAEVSSCKHLDIAELT